MPQVNKNAPAMHRNLPLLLLQAREAVLARFRPLLQANGLTEQQWRVLRVLVEEGELEPRQIVQRCGISSPSLAGVLARMQGQGLISRRSLPHDARRQGISASDSSRQLVRSMAPQIALLYAQLSQQLGEGFVDQLSQTLDHLLAALEDGSTD